MQLTCNLSNLSPAVRQKIVDKLQREDLAAQAVAWSEQERVAKLYRDATIVGAAREGVGPLSSWMHIGLKQLLAAHYGHEVVYQDPDFQRFIDRKHNGIFGVRERPTRIQSGWRPSDKPRSYQTTR